MKKKISFYVLIYLLVFLLMRGSSCVYLFLWGILGLPAKWWVGVIVGALSGLTVWGLYKWIERVCDES